MKTLVLVFALVAAASAGGRAAAQAPDPAAATVATSPTSALVDDIIKLWKANLSEEFIDKYIAHSDVARGLSAEDVVQLRNAGVPESLITSITLQGTENREVAVVPQAATSPGGSRRWDGLARRNPGLVLFKSRWDPGVLEFKDASLRWIDARDAGKNLLVPLAQMTEQQLTCLKKPGGNECFEWVVKTRGEEYRFRDVAWSQGENAKVLELFEFFRSAFPTLVSSRRPVDEK